MQRSFPRNWDMTLFVNNNALNKYSLSILSMRSLLGCWNTKLENTDNFPGILFQCYGKRSREN